MEDLSQLASVEGSSIAEVARRSAHCHLANDDGSASDPSESPTAPFHRRGCTGSALVLDKKADPEQRTSSESQQSSFLLS